MDLKCNLPTCAKSAALDGVACGFRTAQGTPKRSRVRASVVRRSSVLSAPQRRIRHPTRTSQKRTSRENKRLAESVENNTATSSCVLFNPQSVRKCSNFSRGSALAAPHRKDVFAAKGLLSTDGSFRARRALPGAGHLQPGGAASIAEIAPVPLHGAAHLRCVRMDSRVLSCVRRGCQLSVWLAAAYFALGRRIWHSSRLPGVPEVQHIKTQYERPTTP